MFDDYGDHGFASLAVNLNENMEVVKNYARQYTYLHWRDDLSVWGVYRQQGYIPLNYVVDANGTIRYVAEGFNEAAIRQVVLQWLPDPIDHDVGVRRLLAPAGGVDSGQTVVPACSVYNYGLNAETYPVRMKVGSEYNLTAMVTDHQPGTARYVEFPAWTPMLRGQATATCTTELAGDDVKTNNVATALVTVYVYDLAVTAILAPPDSVDSAAVVVPSAVVKNLGNWADMAKVKFFIGEFYADSVNVPLQPGRCDTAELRAWTALELGSFPVRCTVIPRKDMVISNNLLTRTVHVVRVIGVEEPAGAPARLTLFEARPNPAGARTEVRYRLPHAARVELCVYSSSGGFVRTLRSGPAAAGEHSVVWDGRDESGVLAGRGVYYLRLEAGGSRVTKKLVMAE